MTIPDYDKECDCEFCDEEHRKRNASHPQPSKCIHEKVCRSITKAINEMPGKLAFLKCEDLGECQFFDECASHSSTPSEQSIRQDERERVLDEAIDKIASQLNKIDRKWKGMIKSIEILEELCKQERL